MSAPADQPAARAHGARDAPGQEPLLRARSLAFTTDTRTLWRDLEVSLHCGERLAIAGASGTGKTLLLRTLAGLEPLTSGQIVYRGKSVSAWPMPEYRSRIVYVSQNPRLREGSVRETLETPFRFRAHHSKPFPADTVLAHLSAVGRSDAFLTQRTERLSGGEAQIVIALRALITEPEILLLDEPTASLDDTAARSIESLVERWMAGDRSRAFIWTSHDESQLARVCDRTIELAQSS